MKILSIVLAFFFVGFQLLLTVQIFEFFLFNKGVF